MRTPFVAGNWKMNKTVAEARDLVSVMGKELNKIENIDIVLCPPFISILAIANLLQDTKIGVGAQNIHWEEKGAFTGEVSPSMVKEFCNYVIIGHSERRSYFGETNETVNKKVHAAIKNGLTPIVCIGETLEENKAGRTAEVVSSQTLEGLKGIDAATAAGIVVAYEPVWAIGTGLAATADDAQNVHKNILRKSLTDLFGEDAAQKIRILYGGSVNAANAADYFTREDIDGALVGGASLKTEDFVAIAKAASK
jgi:triosephosphate isomerase